MRLGASGSTSFTSRFKHQPHLLHELQASAPPVPSGTPSTCSKHLPHKTSVSPEPAAALPCFQTWASAQAHGADTLAHVCECVCVCVHALKRMVLTHVCVCAHGVSLQMLKQELSHLAPKHEVDALKRMVLDAQQELIRLQVGGGLALVMRALEECSYRAGALWRTWAVLSWEAHCAVPGQCAPEACVSAAPGLARFAVPSRCTLPCLALASVLCCSWLASMLLLACVLCHACPVHCVLPGRHAVPCLPSALCHFWPACCAAPGQPAVLAMPGALCRDWPVRGECYLGSHAVCSVHGQLSAWQG